MPATAENTTIGTEPPPFLFDADAYMFGDDTTGAEPPPSRNPFLFDATNAAAASTGFDFGTDACMFVTIGDTEPRLPFPPSRNEFLFSNDPRNGDIQIAGLHGDIVATVAAALSEASGTPSLAAGATRILVETGS